MLTILWVPSLYTIFRKPFTGTKSSVHRRLCLYCLFCYISIYFYISHCFKKSELIYLDICKHKTNWLTTNGRKLRKPGEWETSQVISLYNVFWIHTLVSLPTFPILEWSLDAWDLDDAGRSQTPLQSPTCLHVDFGKLFFFFFLLSDSLLKNFSVPKGLH